MALKRPTTALDQLIADLKSVLRMDPPAARVLEHGGAVVAYDYLRGSGIASHAFRDRCEAEGLRVEWNSTSDSYLVTTK